MQHDFCNKTVTISDSSLQSDSVVVAGTTVTAGTGLVATTGGVTLAGAVIDAGVVASLAVDSVVSIDPTRQTGLFILTVNGASGARSAHVYVDMSATPAAIKTTTLIGSVVNVSTATLTGTTGAASKITISAHDGIIQVENRLAGAVGLTWVLL